MFFRAAAAAAINDKCHARQTTVFERNMLSCQSETRRIDVDSCSVQSLIKTFASVLPTKIISSRRRLRVQDEWFFRRVLPRVFRFSATRRRRFGSKNRLGAKNIYIFFFLLLNDGNRPAPSALSISGPGVKRERKTLLIL